MDDAKIQQIIDRIFDRMQSDQRQHFYASVGLTCLVFACLLTIRTYDMSLIMNRLDEHRGGTSNTLSVAREPTAVDLAREILIKEGKL